MNGVRTTFMRRGYLLTALSALLLLAASAGTAEAQRVTIGFDGTSGTISENAYINNDALAQPQIVTLKVEGLAGGSRRGGDITSQLGTNISITPNMPVWFGTVGAGGVFTKDDAVTAANAARDIPSASFTATDVIALVVSQSEGGAGDDNWLHERIELKLEVGGSASVSPDIFTVTIEDQNVAPAVVFHQSSFTLTEGAERDVALDIVTGRRGAPIPAAAQEITQVGPATARSAAVLTVRVSNHRMVNTGSCVTDPNATGYGRHAIALNLDTADWTFADFANTGLLKTADAVTIGALAAGGDPATVATTTADMNIQACPDTEGIQNPEIMFSILDRNLTGATGGSRTSGDFSIGAPLMVTVESDEAAPTLSFSPTDVTIDEGGSVETVLLADGPNAGEVGMVKLMVEGDAMVDLYQGDEMLEEMNGYVMVDLGGDSSARLMAMSMESRELQDGDMAYKAWKLVEGETDGADIGEGSWFRVDVVGSTAVPALPLIGQLLLALFLMAGGSRLYRRRQG